MLDLHRKSADAGRLLRRSFVFACLASLLLCSQSKADVTILAYSQNQGGTPLTLTNLGNGTSTLTGTENVSIGTLDGLGTGATPPLAVLKINATSFTAASGPDVNGNDSQQFAGTFSITAGTINYLSGTFSDVVSGKDKGFSMSLGVSQPPDSVTFTSNVLPAGSYSNPPLGMSLSFTNLTKALTIDPKSLGAKGATHMANSGVFSAGAVPEPSTFLVASIGGLGLIAYGLRRRKALGV